LSGPFGSSGSDARVGTTLADRYRIDALIGEGGMGRVYAAEHVLMRKRLAIKVLRRELTTMPEVVARFEREAMAAANIDHPNVAAATDFGKLTDGAVFLVLEYVQGKSLRDEVAAGPLAPERALHVARQIAAGLASAHALDIVHRDLKPENVMLVEKGGDPDFVKVLDFGIAKVPIGEVPSPSHTPAHTPITKAGMVFGTPEYMAPEQALGQTVDGRADLYALGVILYEMLSGSRPFSSQSQVGILGQQLSKLPPKISDRAPGIVVPPAVEAVTMRLLQREAADRYQSAGEVVDVINRLLAPIPGRGIYRFTLPEGSPSQPPPSEEVLALREAITVSTAPRALPPTPIPFDDSHPDLEGFSRGRSLDDKLIALRARLPGPFQTVPPRVLFGVLAGLAVVLVVLVGSALSSGDDGEAARAGAPGSPSAGAVGDPALTPAKEGPFARPDELGEAKAGGVKAYEALLEKYPRDPNIAVEMAREHASKKNYSGAVGAVGRALTIDPAFQSNAQVASLVFQAAQVKASSEAAFLLVEGPMGARGADISYDLVTTPNVRPWVQSRAETFLQSPGFEKIASPGLRAIVKLRYSAGCDEKRALLADVKKSSDERALFELVPLQDKTGCGARKKDDCYSCLRVSNDLDDTIAAVRTRKR
jgi:serine/threonine protein kinase